MNLLDKLLPVECYASQASGFVPAPLVRVRFIVQHFFSVHYVRPETPYDLELCWQLFRDMAFEPPARQFGLTDGPRAPASAHILIDRDGMAHRLVPLDVQAWHAGVSEWNGFENLNVCSIGIENIGHYGESFTDAQYRANAGICRELLVQHNLVFADIVGHEQVAMPRGRKKDPGPTFDWHRLERYIDSARMNA